MTATGASFDRRMRHMDHLEAKHPDCFCWAKLVFEAASGRDASLHEALNLDECKSDARREGFCWCCKWVCDNGTMRLATEADWPPEEAYPSC